jgi:TrpR-related protein YerC/YecD
MYHSKFKSDTLDHLFEALLHIKTKEEFYQVFEDLCTIQELKELGARFEIATKLDQKFPYHVIIEETGGSSATISRVAKALSYGANGYRLLLDRNKK